MKLLAKAKTKTENKKRKKQRKKRRKERKGEEGKLTKILYWLLKGLSLPPNYNLICGTHYARYIT